MHVQLPYSMYYLSMMYYVPITVFEQRLRGRVLSRTHRAAEGSMGISVHMCLMRPCLYIVSAHTIYHPFDLDLLDPHVLWCGYTFS